MKRKLELLGVTQSFGGNSRDSVVLSDLSLYVGEGEFVSIIGPSGSGKSTLFQIVGGVLRPDCGRIMIEGRDVTGVTGHISYMPQHNTLLPWRNVLDNIVLGLEVAGGTPKREAARMAGEWLQRIGLSEYEKAYPHVLSGGMQQRVAFLRAMLSPQPVMCLDEPFGALDALTRSEMQRWLLGLWEQDRRSVLFVTHSIEEALFLSDRIYLFSDKPTSVVEEVPVAFERPRADDLFRNPEFIRLRGHIYDLMKKEAATG